MELLLSVEDRFLLAGRGLVLAPDLPLPYGESNPVFTVIVECPGGTRLQAQAGLRLDHFRPGGDKLIVHLPGLDRTDVPVVSKVCMV